MSADPVREVDFERPPLNEVVFSIQFERDVTDEVGILSEFWGKIRADYPGLEKQMPLPPAMESFDAVIQPPAVQFELLMGAPSQRYWFLSADQTLIVQVQPDRLMFNWRKVVGDEEYPHYDTLAPRFAELIELFLSCESVAGNATVGWCELQYVNPVEADGPENTHGQLARIVNFLEADPPHEHLPPVEDTQIQQRRRILDENGDPRGRLYLTAVPAVRATDGGRAYVITLLARGRPAKGELPDSAFGFLNEAHDLIVKGFREVTTSEMHERWGEK